MKHAAWIDDSVKCDATTSTKDVVVVVDLSRVNPCGAYEKGDANNDDLSLRVDILDQRGHRRVTDPNANSSAA